LSKEKPEVHHASGFIDSETDGNVTDRCLPANHIRSKKSTTCKHVRL